MYGVSRLHAASGQDEYSGRRNNPGPGGCRRPRYRCKEGDFGSEGLRRRRQMQNNTGLTFCFVEKLYFCAQ